MAATGHDRANLAKDSGTGTANYIPSVYRRKSLGGLARGQTLTRAERLARAARPD